ncbi:structural constituent of ribosome [Raphanus sativus]|nr:structural constituent of ribosome [Raphanus sativus]
MEYTCSFTKTGLSQGSCLRNTVSDRKLWANEVVSQAIESVFILSQVYDDTTEGEKISTFYRIEYSPPVVLLINPVTGQKMRSWSGVIEAHGFVEDLMKCIDHGPHEYMASLTRNTRICSESSQTGG